MTPLVLMGVSGSGKSTVGLALARALGAPFADGDAFHSPTALTSLSTGVALTDEDRWPWLARLREWLDAHPDGVLACSALRRPYRDVLRPARFVHLDVPAQVLRSRVVGRVGHVMPASLLPSQLALLEPLQPDEDGVVVDGARPVDEAVEQVLRALA